MRSEAMAKTQLSGSAPESLGVDAPAGAIPGTLATGVIQVLTGANAGRELLLTKASTTLGRPGLQVAVISRKSEGYFIHHVEGSKFPRVNGNMIGSQAHSLKDRDIIEIAGVRMAFSLKA